MITYNYIKNEEKKITEEIASLKANIKKAPKGRLQCYNTASGFRWYCASDNDAKKRKYISKENRDLAVKLAFKKYQEERLYDLLAERKAIQSFLNKFPKNSRAENFMLKSSEHQALLRSAVSGKSEKILAWSAAPFETNPNYKESLTVKTGLGFYVRSKSERDIAIALTNHGIPFRYECRFEVNGIVIYPDFMIMHPETGEIFIWEHFGLMDQKNYTANVEFKLRTYRETGYIPMVNLITTYETKEKPLDLNLVEDLIEHFFL